MAYLLGLVVVLFFFLALHYFTELNFIQKMSVSIVTLFIIFGAIMFNISSENQRKKMMDVVIAFNQNKSVKCGEYEVNSTVYTLSIGTYTFIGKQNTPAYAQMISVSECE